MISVVCVKHIQIIYVMENRHYRYPERFSFFLIEMVRHSRGRYTALHLDRCSKISGAFGRDVARLLAHSMGLSSTQHKSTHEMSCDDIRTFVTHLQPHGLLSYVPGREFHGVTIPDRSPSLRSPDKLGERLHELSVDKDFWASLRGAPEEDDPGAN